MLAPSSRVLDLFAVPDDLHALAGGQGASVRAGDLVLSPGRDAGTQAWLSPVLARLAVRLDEDPRRTARDLRVALPVPARDGTWVVDGWAATRFEPGTEMCRDLDVVRRAGDLLHAHLAVAVPTRPSALDERTDRWAVAERIAFGDLPLAAGPSEVWTPAQRLLAERLLAALDPAPSPDTAQIVHADLAGNVLLDLGGAPLMIDVSPAWRPPRWADAVCVLDSVLWFAAPVDALAQWARGADREAMVRAVLFRLLSDRPADVAAFQRAAEPLL